MTLGCVYCSISSRNMFLEAYSAIEVMTVDDVDLCLWMLCYSSLAGGASVGFQWLPGLISYFKRFVCQLVTTQA